jgi:hypothetical protein
MSQEFKPGDKVLKSGIYKVMHDSKTQSHEVTCVEGEPFPPCNSCGHPKYVLVRATQHVA